MYNIMSIRGFKDHNPFELNCVSVGLVMGGCTQNIAFPGD